MLIFES